MSNKLLKSKDIEIKLSLSDYLSETQMMSLMDKLNEEVQKLLNLDGETIEVVYSEWEPYENEFEEELE